MGHKDKKIIIFVCKGNIHRSAIAEQVFKKIIKEKNLKNKYKVISRGIRGSAGTKAPLYKNITQYKDWQFAKPSLDEFGIDITSHKSQPINKYTADKASVIITFDDIVLNNDPAALLNQFPNLHKKIHLLSELENKIEDIPDCYGIDDPKYYRLVTKKIYDILYKNWVKLIDWANK